VRVAPLVGPVDAAAPVTRCHVASELLVLVAEQLQEKPKKKEEPLQEGKKPAPAPLDELLRLLKVARMLLGDADEMRDFVHLIRWDGEQEKLQQWAVRVDHRAFCRACTRWG
jgi:hypothetical protein